MGAKTVDTNSTSQNNSSFHPNSQAGAAYSSELSNAQGLGGLGPNGISPSSLVAPINQQQATAISDINNVGNAELNASGVYQPYYSQASGHTDAGAGALAPGNFASTVGQYENPYIQNVIGSTLANINQQNQLQDQGAIGNAIQAGNAFGGDRMGLGLSALANQQDLASNQTIAGLESAGYNQATGVAEQGAANQLQAGAQYGNLGSGAQAAALAGPQAQLAAQQAALAGGTLEQQTSQAMATAPEQQATWLTGIDTGLGGSMSYTSANNGSGTQTVPDGNIGSSILGGVTAAAGLLKLKRGGSVGALPHFDAGGPTEGPGSIPGLDAGSGGILSQAIITAGKHPGLLAQPYQQPSNMGALSQAASGSLGSTSSIPTASQLQGDYTAGQTIGNTASGLFNSNSTVPMGGAGTNFRKGGSVRGYDEGGVIDAPDVSDSALAALLPPQPNYGSLGSGPVNDNSAPEPQAATGTLGALPSFGNVPPNAMQQLTANSGAVLNPDINQAFQQPTSVGNIGSIPAAAPLDYNSGPAADYANQMPAPPSVSQETATAPSGLNPSAYINQMPSPNVSRETFASLGDVPTPPVRPIGLGSTPGPAPVPDAPTSLASAPAYPGSNGGSMYTGPVHLASMGSTPIDSGSAAQPSLGSSPPGNAHSLLGALFTNESGLQNIANTHQGTSSGQAQGYFQITTGTWKEFADKAGVDTSKYPNALSAPYDVQASVAANIPLKRWDPTTLSAIRNAGFAIDPNKTLGENVAATGGDFTADALAYDGARRGGTGNVSAAPASQAINAASSPSGNLGSAPAAADTAAAPQHGLTGLLGDNSPLKSLGINLSPDARMALISAGLGMMASRSPFLGQAIGEGGLAGMKTYQGQQQLDLQRQNIDSETALRNAQTQGALTENELKRQNLDIRKQALAGFSPGATAAGLQKDIANNAKGLSQDPDAPAAQAGDNGASGKATGQPAIPPNQNPVVLRAQAQKMMDNAQRLAFVDPAAANVWRENAQQLLGQATEITKGGRYTAVDDQGNVGTYNLEGYSQAEGNIAGARAKAEADARNAAMPTVDPLTGAKYVGGTGAAPTPNAATGQTQSKPFSIDPATAAVSTQIPPAPKGGGYIVPNMPSGAKLTELPEATKNQMQTDAEFQKDQIATLRATPTVISRTQAIAQAFKTFQSGSLTDHQHDAAALASALGFPAVAKGIMQGEISGPEWVDKEGVQSVLDTLKSATPRFAQSEFNAVASHGTPNTTNQPQANHEMVAEMLALGQRNKAFMNDWESAKQQGWSSPSAFYDAWDSANPVNGFIKSAQRQIGNFAGMDLPSPKDWTKGTVYVAPSKLPANTGQLLGKFGVQPGTMFRFNGNDSQQPVQPINKADYFSAQLGQ